MEEFGAEYKLEHERLLCPQNYWPGRVRRGLRVQEGRHGQDVRHEMPGQKTYQNETRGNSCSQREDNALLGFNGSGKSIW